MVEVTLEASQKRKHENVMELWFLPQDTSQLIFIPFSLVLFTEKFQLSKYGEEVPGKHLDSS